MLLTVLIYLFVAVVFSSLFFFGVFNDFRSSDKEEGELELYYYCKCTGDNFNKYYGELAHTLFETNERFSLYYCDESGGAVACCRNKPSDNKEVNLVWKLYTVRNIDKDILKGCRMFLQVAK